MNPTIDSLLKLHEFDLALDTLRRELDALAPKRAAADGALRRLTSRLEESKKALTQSQLERKQIEADVEAQDQSIRKHSGELNVVKSNDAYKALLAEIDTAKEKKRASEDKILELMERQETVQKEFKELEAGFAAEKAVIDQEIAALEAEKVRLESAAAEKASARDAYFQSLPEETRRPYESVRRGRPAFSVLAEVKGMICQGCRTTLPPDVVNQVMKGRIIITCDACSRILFIRPAPPEPKPA